MTIVAVGGRGLFELEPTEQGVRHLLEPLSIDAVLRALADAAR